MHRYRRVPHPPQTQRCWTWRRPFTANGRACHTIFPPPITSLRHIHLPPLAVWPIRAHNRRDNHPTPTRRRTPTLRRRCSQRTRIRRRKASRTRSPIEHHPRARTCRCRRSICLQFVCRMASRNHLRKCNPDSSLWALRSRHHSTECLSTMRMPAIPRVSRWLWDITPIYKCDTSSRRKLTKEYCREDGTRRRSSVEPRQAA